MFQVLWQGHTIQVENGSGGLQTIPGTYTMEFGPHVDTGELDVDTKPKVEKKMGKKKKKNDSESDEEVLDNKLEDNPLQVCTEFTFVFHFCVMCVSAAIICKCFSISGPRAARKGLRLQRQLLSRSQSWGSVSSPSKHRWTNKEWTWHVSNGHHNG